jgi:hypothetical protein
MVLDTLGVAWFETAFPNVLLGAAKYVGGMRLLAYASVLLSGFVPPRRENGTKP